MRVILAALLLVLGGCGSSEVPVPVKPTRSTGPDVLPIKLKALTTDRCFLDPRNETAKGCQKYVTELAGLPGSVRQRRPELTVHADALERGVAAYRAANCQDQAAAGGPCGQSLVDMSAALATIENLVGG